MTNRNKVIIITILGIVFIAGCIETPQPNTPKCGNGICESKESPQICPADCKVTPTINVSKTENSEKFFMGINGVQREAYNGVEDLDTYVQWFDKMNKNDANVMRLRVDGRSIGVETEPGVIDEVKAAFIDDVLDEGVKKGIYFMVTLFNANFGINRACSPLVAIDWKKSIYCGTDSKKECRRFQNPQDFYTNPDAMQLQKQTIGKIVERWEDYDNIIAWELMNEAILCEEYIVDWHDEMSSYIRKISDKPITTSIRSESKTEQALIDSLWNLENIDIVQRHIYDSKDMGVDMYQYAKEYTERYDKDVFFGEFGILSIEKDPEGVNLHNSLWASYFGGGYGLAYWETNKHLDKLDLYHHFRGLGSFIGDRDNQDYQKFSIENRDALIYGLKKQNETLLWVRNMQYYWSNRNQNYPTVSGLTIDLSSPGTAVFYNTITGSEISRARFDSILAVPNFDKDIGIKIRERTTNAKKLERVSTTRLTDASEGYGARPEIISDGNYLYVIYLGDINKPASRKFKLKILDMNLNLIDEKVLVTGSKDYGNPTDIRISSDGEHVYAFYELASKQKGAHLFAAKYKFDK